MEVFGNSTRPSPLSSRFSKFPFGGTQGRGPPCRTFLYAARLNDCFKGRVVEGVVQGVTGSVRALWWWWWWDGEERCIMIVKVGEREGGIDMGKRGRGIGGEGEISPIYR